MFTNNTCPLLLEERYVSPGTTSPIKIKNTGDLFEAMTRMNFSEGFCVQGRTVLDLVSSVRMISVLGH